MNLIGPYLVACTLLVVAGAAKAARPGDTARALGVLVASVPPRAMSGAVRVAASLEALLGLTALLLPRAGLAAAVAGSYTLFAAFVLVARARGGPLATCGCFGTPDTPPTLLHAAVDLGLAASAVAVAWTAPTGTLASLLTGQPWHGGALLAVCALGAWVTYLALTRLPRLQAARALVERSPR